LRSSSFVPAGLEALLGARLFDLVRDPNERSLGGTPPSIELERYRRLLEDHLRDCRARQQQLPLGKSVAPPSAEEVRRLKALGYLN
jgi:hypothetical protein